VLRLGLAGAALLLGGCGLFGGGGPVSCPQAVVLDDASRLTRFAPSGRDVVDVLFEAEISQAALGCSYDDGVVDATLQLEIIAARGPADRERVGRFGYFVAVVDRGQNILARQRFDSQVEFPDNQLRSGILEEVDQHIPLRGSETGGDYFVFVGFELTPEEVEYNRQQQQ
jgi:hypothetical protein